MTRDKRFMITARDVAKELGIAISTVGRAMADDPRISAEMKARVRDAAGRLGYVGNNAARMMRGGSSKLIGLMIPDVSNDFYAAIAQALSECAERQGYRVILSLTKDDRETEARHIRELVGARVAGVILVPTAKPKRESRTLLATLPYVQFLRHVPMLGETWFGIDDETVIGAATDYLIASGHRRIAYIGGHTRLSTGAARLAGYRNALAKANIPEDPDIQFTGDPSAQFGADAMNALLRIQDRPTAVLMASAHITMGGAQALQSQGITVPDAISLVGFGNAPWLEWWGGGLTAITPPIEELASSCGLWFLDTIAAKDRKTLSSHSVITRSSLVVRKSVRALSPP